LLTVVQGVACVASGVADFRGLAVGLAAEISDPAGASVPPDFPHLLQPRNWPRAVATGMVR
jgi:hypothetical protein